MKKQNQSFPDAPLIMLLKYLCNDDNDQLLKSRGMSFRNRKVLSPFFAKDKGDEIGMLFQDIGGGLTITNQPAIVVLLLHCSRRKKNKLLGLRFVSNPRDIHVSTDHQL